MGDWRSYMSMTKKADLIPGGLADEKSDSDFDNRQLEMGTKVEREHTNSDAKAREITRDHLEEHGDYYTRLKKMEDKAEEAKEKKAGDMPSFTDQDRPKKVKEIYRALKRDHPDMPAEMKARIAARQGKKGKQKQGPPYKGPITSKYKESMDMNAMSLLVKLALGEPEILMPGEGGPRMGAARTVKAQVRPATKAVVPYSAEAAREAGRAARAERLAAILSKIKGGLRAMKGPAMLAGLAGAGMGGIGALRGHTYVKARKEDPNLRMAGKSFMGGITGGLKGGLAGAGVGGLLGAGAVLPALLSRNPRLVRSALRGAVAPTAGVGGLAGTALGATHGGWKAVQKDVNKIKDKKRREKKKEEDQKKAAAAKKPSSIDMSKNPGEFQEAMGHGMRTKDWSKFDALVKEKQASLNQALGVLWEEYGPGQEKHAAAGYFFYEVNKNERDAEALGAPFCKLAGSMGKEPWDLAKDVVKSYRGLEVLSKTASDPKQRELAQFYMDWADREMEKAALLNTVLRVGRAAKAGLGAMAPSSMKMTKAVKTVAKGGAPAEAQGVRQAVKGSLRDSRALQEAGGGSIRRGQQLAAKDPGLLQAGTRARPPVTQGPPPRAPIQGAPPPAPAPAAAPAGMSDRTKNLLAGLGITGGVGAPLAYVASQP